MLVVHPHFHPRHTGVTTHTIGVATALAPRCEVKVMGQLLPPELPRITFAELWRRAGREPVVFHAHRNNELLLGLFVRLLRRGLKLVYTRHGSYAPGWFTRTLMRLADAVVTLNDDAARQVRRPSTLVRHGVSTERFHPPEDRAAAWRALGLPGEHGVGVVGRIRADKGQGDFVEAIAPLLDRFPGWTPVLVGLARPGEQAWANELRAKTGGRLQLPGEQRDVAPWYRGLSIFVMPSHAESFGLVLLEAMASGCCVIASRLPHVPRYVEDGVTGFTFAPKDVDGLRRALEAAMADPQRAAEVGRAAAQAVRERFGIDDEARQLHDVYRALAGP